MGYCKHASFPDTVASTQHSIWSIATPSTTDFALRFAAATGDVHEFRWCSWLPRNDRHCVLMFLKFPSIISQLYIWRVSLVRHLPLHHLQMGSLHVQCQVRVGWRSDFSGGGFILFRYMSCLVAFNEVLSFWQLRYRKKQCQLWAGLCE